jgi:hypothetical protein
MVGQFGGQRPRAICGPVSAGLDQPGGYFPNRIMAGEEYDAALLQYGDRVAGRFKNTGGVLAFRRANRRGAGRDQCVGPEPGISKSRKLVLIPDGLIEQRKLSRPMCGGDRKKIWVSECEDLRVERVALQVQPGPPISVLYHTCLRLPS